jgi:hypothetical protein
MSNGIDFNTSGIAQIRVAGNWLAANGRLPVCIGKPPLRVNEILADSVAPGISAFAQAILLQNENGSSPLQTWFGGEAGMVLFPEYSFSSQDFPTLDASVRQHPTRLIVLAGFGAVLGSDLAALLQNGCSAGWQNGAEALTPLGKYNAGWCWIHESPGHTRCTVFVKNYIDQSVEIAEIPNLLPLGTILRIETDDLVIYPLICSDLISQEKNAPRARIAQSLPLPANGKRSAICTISCNSAPQSGWWRTAIDDVVQMQQQQAVLIFANQAITEAKPDEASDRWRCLSGAFISRTRMPRPPRAPLPSVRHVSTDVAAGGLILRHPDVGAAVGLIGWDFNPAIGLFVWEPRMRLVWRNGQFESLDGTVDVYETQRFVERRGASMVAEFAEPTQQRIIASLSSLVFQQNVVEVTPRLWPELLDGLRPAKSRRSADEMYLEQNELDSALRIFAAVQIATCGQPVIAGPQRGQLDWNGQDIRVWHSPLLREDQMLAECGKLVLSGGSAPPLIVIGRGRPFGTSVATQAVTPPSQKVVTERQTDITTALGGPTSDIESARPRNVFWLQMGTLEQALLNPVLDFEPEVRAAITNGLNLV